MKKSYHLSKADLRKIITDYFSKNGETVTSCSFNASSEYSYIDEINVMVFVEDSKSSKENNGT